MVFYDQWEITEQNPALRDEPQYSAVPVSNEEDEEMAEEDDTNEDDDNQKEDTIKQGQSNIIKTDTLSERVQRKEERGGGS